MTLLAKLLDRLFQKVYKNRPVRVMAIKTAAILQAIIAGGLMLVKKRPIHLRMTAVTIGVFVGGREGLADVLKVVVAVCAIHGSGFEWMGTEEGERILLLGVALKACLVDAVFGERRCAEGISIVNCMATRAVYTLGKVASGVRIIGLRFAEMTATTDIQGLVGIEASGVGDIIDAGIIHMGLVVDMAG